MMDHIAFYQLKLGLLRDSLDTMLEDLVMLYVRRLHPISWLLTDAQRENPPGNQSPHRREMPKNCRPHCHNAGDV